MQAAPWNWMARLIPAAPIALLHPPSASLILLAQAIRELLAIDQLWAQLALASVAQATDILLAGPIDLAKINIMVGGVLATICGINPQHTVGAVVERAIVFLANRLIS